MTETLAATGSTSLGLGPRDEAWDATEAVQTLEPDDYPRAYFWRNPDADPGTKAAYKLPFARRDSDGLHAVWRAVTGAAAALSGSRGGVDIPDDDIPGVKAKIEAYYTKARKQYDDPTIQPPWAAEQSGTAGVEMFAVAPITHVDVRDPSANPDNTWTMSGYAAVFAQPAIFFDSSFCRMTVEMDPAAFDRVLREQQFGQPDGVVHLNIGHDMNRAIAATDVTAGQPGSLQLSADAYGLRFLAKVSRDDPDAVALAVKMRDGVVRQASIAFVCSRDQTVIEEEDGTGRDLISRRILEVGHLYDVCATPQGAFPQTSAQLQEFARLLTKFGHAPATTGAGRERHAPDGAGATPVTTARVAKPRLTADQLQRIRRHRHI